MLAAGSRQDAVKSTSQIHWGLSKAAYSPSCVSTDVRLPIDYCRLEMDTSYLDSQVRASCGRPSHSHLDLTAVGSKEVAPCKLEAS
jgi:hypothetical protein